MSHFAGALPLHCRLHTAGNHNFISTPPFQIKGLQTGSRSGLTYDKTRAYFGSFHVVALPL